MASRTGGQILVEQLKIQNVEHVFCVPGESYLAVLDALYDTDIAVTVCRQEGGAAMMAEAHGKLSGKPGICMVTRAPGATNAFAGIHIASQDSTPMILFVGQIARTVRGREAFQEMDYRAVFGSQVKWVAEIDDADRIPEIVSRAFHIAQSGRPGPVVIALPEDMLISQVQVANAKPVALLESAPTPQQWAHLAVLLNRAQKPLFILGGSAWSAQATADFAAFALEQQFPVAVQFRRQMLFPATHPCYIGDIGLGVNPQLLDRVRESDLLILLGGRMSEVPSQNYQLIDIPNAKQTLIHIHPDNQELNKVYQAELGINTSPRIFATLCKQMLNLAPRNDMRLQQAHQDYLHWSDSESLHHPGALQLGEMMRYLNHVLPDDAIITNGAGNYATWVHRFYRFKQYGTQLAPTSGSMGYGLPAAVAAKKIYPQKTVVCFAGDGCFMMHGQEFATAVQYNLPIIVILMDNGMYGTIRMHQERHYPGRVSATELKNPNFAQYAVAFGGHGETVNQSSDFIPAFERALASNKAAIIHCLIDPEAISPSTTLSAIRNKHGSA